MRYIGQAFELSVPVNLDSPEPEQIDQAFREVYAARYGSAPDGGSEIVSYRLAAWGVSEKPELMSSTGAGGGGGPSQTSERSCVFAGSEHNTPLHNRKALSVGSSVNGPAIIEEPSTATIIPPGWSARADKLGCLILERIS